MSSVNVFERIAIDPPYAQIYRRLGYRKKTTELALVKQKESDLYILKFHTHYCAPGHTFCAHSPVAMEPLQSGLIYFHDDFMRHIKEKHCPWRS